MKKVLLILGIFGLITTSAYYVYRNFFDEKKTVENKVKTWNDRDKSVQNEMDIQDGDLIFQTSLSGQSQAIQLATNSEYSHCGIIYSNNDQFYVFEAVQSVKTTSLDKWIARGENEHYVIKRLKNADQVLTAGALQKMKRVGEKFKGKKYDLTFEWSDDKIYCSELIWKVYQRATGVEIGQLEKLSDFDLTHDAVKKKMNERYGDKIPMDEIVISPAAIFESKLLLTVKTE
ncbi:MAG: YiiX family permuted papain-like enzyme [Bacteroidota bacterium]